MKKNYIISIDLNKIYHNLNSDSEFEIKLDSKTKFKNLISSYYTSNTIDYTDDIITLKDDFISKFNIDNNSLLLLDKTKFPSPLGEENIKFQRYNQGLILIDMKMLIRDDIILNIDYIYENYQNISLNKMYDNYLLYFGDKSSVLKKLADKKDLFNSKLYNIFYEDLVELNLWQQINNIPNKINSQQFIKKINNDINYMKNIKQHTYKNFYSNFNNQYEAKIITYEKSIYYDINSDNYIVNYNLNNHRQKNIDKTKYHTILNSLHQYYNYIDNLMSNIDKPISVLNSNITSKAKLSDDFSYLSNYEKLENKNDIIKIINPNELFNYSKILNLYSLLNTKSINNSNLDYIFKMSDVFDNKLEIIQVLSDNKNIFTSDNFVNSTIIFLNELIKKKINKLIKSYNFINNETNILNHIRTKTSGKIFLEI